MIPIVDINDIPSAQIEISETPAQGKDYDDDLIKFSNITSKTPYGTVRNFTVIDVETTGLSSEKHEILEVCAIRFRDGLPTEKFSTLTSSTKKIPPRITKINGITPEMVKDCPHFSLIADSLVKFVGSDNIVGHNLEFDLNFLLHHGADFTAQKRKYFDTLTLAQRILKTPQKKWDPDLEDYEIDYDNYDVDNYKLATLCDYYHIQLFNAHRASGDSYATGLLFLELADERTSHVRYYSMEQAKNAHSQPRHVPLNIVEADYLRGLTTREFTTWAGRFIDWTQGLPSNADSQLVASVNKQMDIIHSEMDRREQHPDDRSFFDKISPVLPLIYIGWFGGIAIMTFFLLSLIF